jgi:hypothetical protein
MTSCPRSSVRPTSVAQSLIRPKRFSGVGSSILKQMLPVIAGILISGLMGKSGKAAAPQESPTSSGAGGGLGDILGQIFGRGVAEPRGESPSPRQIPMPGGQPIPFPADPGTQQAPGGDLLSQILLELQKGIQEGRIKPVIIGGGPIQIPMPGGQGGPAQIPIPGGQAGPSGPQVPGGEILGQILRARKKSIDDIQSGRSAPYYYIAPS